MKIEVNDIGGICKLSMDKKTHLPETNKKDFSMESCYGLNCVSLQYPYAEILIPSASKMRLYLDVGSLKR